MSHISNQILEEQEFSRKEIEAMPEPETPDVCELCGGTGEVSVDESDGEGHIMNGVGTRKCICRLEDLSDNNQE